MYKRISHRWWWSGSRASGCCRLVSANQSVGLRRAGLLSSSFNASSVLIWVSRERQPPCGIQYFRRNASERRERPTARLLGCLGGGKRVNVARERLRRLNTVWLSAFVRLLFHTAAMESSCLHSSLQRSIAHPFKSHGGKACSAGIDCLFFFVFSRQPSRV